MGYVPQAPAPIISQSQPDHRCSYCGCSSKPTDRGTCQNCGAPFSLEGQSQLTPEGDQQRITSLFRNGSLSTNEVRYLLGFEPQNSKPSLAKPGFIEV